MRGFFYEIFGLINIEFKDIKKEIRVPINE